MNDTTRLDPHWERGAWPTAVQFRDWFVRCPPKQQLEVAERYLADAQTAHDCFLMNHKGAVEQVSIVTARLAEAEGALPDLMATAWDQGYASGHSNAMRRMSDEPNAPTTPNPYSAALASPAEPGEGERVMNAQQSTENDVHEVWGIQFPPSEWVGRQYPTRELAEKALSFEPDGVLVSRFVTEWKRVIPPRSTPSEDVSRG